MSVRPLESNAMTKRQPKTNGHGRAASAAAHVPHHTLLGLELTGGFLAGAKLDFADGLNCLIGGRGTGKTTVLELMRYALSPETRLSAARAKFIQSNLGGGRVRLKVRTKHGASYWVERPWNDACQVLSEHGAPTTLSLERDIFKADIYSQSEIEEIATSAPFQLQLIDKFEAEDIRRIEADQRRLLAELEQNAIELAQLGRDLADLEETTAETSAIEEKLRALQEVSGTEAETINRAHEHKALRERERKALELLRADLRRANTEAGNLISGLTQRLASRLDTELFAGPNAELLRTVGERVHELMAVLEDAAVRVGQAVETSEAELIGREAELAVAHAQQEQAYRQFVAQLNEEQSRAQERTRLQKQHVVVTTARKELEARQKERARKEEQRRSALDALAGLRNQRFQLRRQIAERLTTDLDPVIRVSVTQGNDREAYRSILAEVLKGTGLRNTAQTLDRIIQSIGPEDLANLIQRDASDRLAARAGIEAERARRVIELLRAPDLVYRIETVELGDVPRIELQDVSEYKDSADLSTGQRCTTILSILMLESERPLLIDQPEDNLDNAFIYDTVVKNLRATKGRRQLIFITHNPNIPVLGDAERIFVLASDGKRGSIVRAGDVDEVKDQIETLLEGGKEAFRLRSERYGNS